MGQSKELDPETFNSFVRRVQRGRVAVVPDPLVQQKMMGGLFLPDADLAEKKFASNFRSGRVVGVGLDCTSKVGDRVVYHKRLENHTLFLGSESMSACFLDMADADIVCWLHEDATLVQQIIKPAGTPG